MGVTLCFLPRDGFDVLSTELARLYTRVTDDLLLIASWILSTVERTLSLFDLIRPSTWMQRSRTSRSSLFVSRLMLLTRLSACLWVMARQDWTASTMTMSSSRENSSGTMPYSTGLVRYVRTSMPNSRSASRSA